MKEKIVAELKRTVQLRIDDAQKAINNAQASANEQTKSSAGDKYETGRAMGQLDIEMYTRQLHAATADRTIIENIEAKSGKSNVAGFGALITTNIGKFYMSIGSGKIMIDNEPIMALSPQSPIGEKIYLKKAGDPVEFRGKKVTISAIE